MRNFLKNEWPLIAALASIVLLCLASVALVVEEQRRWDVFSKANKCVKVGEIAPTSNIGTGFDSKGNAIITNTVISRKEGFKCSNGITYWR